MDRVEKEWRAKNGIPHKFQEIPTNIYQFQSKQIVAST